MGRNVSRENGGSRTVRTGIIIAWKMKKVIAIGYFVRGIIQQMRNINGLFMDSLRDRKENDKNYKMYSELQVTTNFSFLRGASHPEELVEYAASLGYKEI